MTRDWRVNRAIGDEWWRPEFDPDSRAVAAGPHAAASAVPFWALMAFSFTLLIAPQYRVPALAPLRLGLVTAAVAIGAHLVDRVVRHEPLTILTREMWLAGGLLAWAVLTAPLSDWPGESVASLDHYIRSLVIFWLLANTVATPRRLRQLAWALSLMSLPLALTAVENFLTGDFLPGALPDLKRIVGYGGPLTANPNDLALMLNLLIPFSVALVLTTERPALRRLLLGVLAADVIAVIFTFSRGGFLTLGTIFAAYAWKLRRQAERTWVWVALLLGLACVPLLPAGYLDRLATIIGIEADRTASAEWRWDDTVVAGRLVLANPIIGTGIGTNALALYQERSGTDPLALYQSRGPRRTVVHNVYLEYAVELGLPGLLLFVLLLVGCVKSAGRIQQRTAGVPALRQLFCLAEAIQVSLVAFAVAALFHPVAYAMYFYYVAGLAVAVKAIGENEQHLRA